VLVEPTDWFRIRHADPFPPEAVAAFRASCAIYRAKMETMLQHWEHLPAVGRGPKPVLTFFEPEVSKDGRVLSMPVRVENKTLGSRSLLQTTASNELYAYLPRPMVFEIEVGLTEPAFQGSGWRTDWWNPDRDTSLKPEEAFQRAGFTVQADVFHPGHAYAVPGWRRRLQWFIAGLRRH
jgi:hypothetical protein